MISATRYRAAAEINRQSQLASEIAKLQQSVSTGKRLSAASDDPVASARISEIRQIQADQVVWTRNIDGGKSIAAAADETLTDVGTSLDRAKELILAGRSDTISAADRTSHASELRAIALDIGRFAQTTDTNGRALFPADPPLAIPVSDTLSLPATMSSADVFDGIAVAGGGTKSIADILNDAADALERPNSATRTADVTASLGEIDVAVNHIVNVRADQGVRAQRFDTAAEMLTGNSERVTDERSSLEDTDLTYALSDFQSKQLALQAAQSVFAQANKRSLFDLLG